MQSSTERKRTLAFLAKSRAREPTNLDADEQVAMVQVRVIIALAPCISSCMSCLNARWISSDTVRGEQSVSHYQHYSSFVCAY